MSGEDIGTQVAELTAESVEKDDSDLSTADVYRVERDDLSMSDVKQEHIKHELNARTNQRDTEHVRICVVVR